MYKFLQHIDNYIYILHKYLNNVLKFYKYLRFYRIINIMCIRTLNLFVMGVTYGRAINIYFTELLELRKYFECIYVLMFLVFQVIPIIRA